MRVMIRVVNLFVVFLAANLIVLIQIASAQYVKLETDTGFRGVYHFQDDKTKKFRFYAVVLAGEADAKGPEGVAHYLEHILYWHANDAKRKGLHAAGYNAWVNSFITTYIATGRREELDTLLGFTRRLLSFPDLPEKFMQEERDIVLREYDFRLVENPGWRMYEKFWRRLAGQNSYARSVIGSRDSIASITLDDARKFHARAYHINNMVLLTSGPMSADEMASEVTKAFKDSPIGPELERPWKTAPLGRRFNAIERFVDTHVTGTQIAQYMVADWKHRIGPYRETYTQIMAYKILNSALPGGLAKPLSTDHFILSDFNIWLGGSLDGKVTASIFGVPDTGIDATQAIFAFRKALKKVAHTPVPRESLERLRTRYLKREKRKKDNWSHQLNNALSHLRTGNMPLSFEAHIKEIEAVTSDDVEALLRALTSSERVIAVDMHNREEKN